MKQTAFWRE